MVDHETWLLDEGDEIVHEKAAIGFSSLTPRARLIYCLWAADYGMRNAGDLTTAADLHPTFLVDALASAQDLGLPEATAAFSLTSEEFERRYFDLFDRVVAELRVLPS